MKKCSIIILNYNGRDLLAQGLPSVLEAVKYAGGDHEIMVVDNGSMDGSADYVRSFFPYIKVVALEKNYGFGEGNNVGVQNASSDLVVLLNNDMIVEENFLQPLLKPFEEDESVFAVGSQIYFQDKEQRRQETGKTCSYWDHGVIRYLHQDVTALDADRKNVPISWASGGAAAFHRTKFLELDGFRSLYSPAYVEDTDLSYRARKRGWKIYFAPESIVYHKHRATSGKRFSHVDLEILIKRNQFLLLWSNITSPKMFAEHLFTLPLRLIKYSLKDRDKTDWKAFLRALPGLFHARNLSRKEKKAQRYRDEELLASRSWKSEFVRKQGRLSILFVCPYVPCLGIHAGGARMFQIIKGLSQYHDVSVLTYIESEGEQQLVDQLRSFCRNVIAIVRGQSLDEPDWFHIKPHRPPKEFANPEMKRVLEEEVCSGRYDIIQFEYLEMGYLAHGVKKYNIPMVLTNHEVQSRNIWQSIKEGGLSFGDKLQLLFEWMIMLNFELNTASLFDMVIILTPAEGKELTAYKPSLPVEVHPTGVDVSYFQQFSLNHEENHAMVFVGYYRHFPNADAMEYFCSSILPLIRIKVPDAKLYIVGAEPTFKLQHMADGDSIVVTGRVDDIRPYIGKSAVYIVPMRLGAGIRGKIMEAWALKKPVVATPIAASGLIVENGKNIIIEDRPQAFAEKVVRLFEDENLRRTLGEEGFNTARLHYDWSSQIKKHGEMYVNLLRRVTA